MGKLCDDLWVEILGRLSSEKDLVPCMSVSRLWHRITSDLWVRRFWAQSPPLGVYFRSIQAPLSPFELTMVDKDPSYLPNMKYISLFNYRYESMADNLESTSGYHHSIDGEYTHRMRKEQWQHSRYYKFDHDDHDEYLHGCNGLLLLLKSGTNQFYVCNPITTQQVPVPKACVHQNYEHCCAALAFDPTESPHHYRVVRIDYTESVSSTPNSSSSNIAMLDIFSSECRQWVRQRLQLDPEFTEGFEKIKLCRQFSYLRDKLYSLAMSWKILCIDLKTVEASELELPVPEANKIGSMGCLGVSLDLLCYVKRMPSRSGKSDELVVWYYDDRCKSSEWTRKYNVCCVLLRCGIRYQGYECNDNVEPYAISPSSDVLFFGTHNLISCQHLKTGKYKPLYHQASYEIVPDYFWVLRACFVPFYQLGNKAVVPERDGLEILDAEGPSKERKDADSKVEVINVKLCDRYTKPLPPLIYPSEIAHDMYWNLNV